MTTNRHALQTLQEHDMPSYTIEHRAVDMTPVDGQPWEPVKVLDRRVVATLEEAREACWAVVHAAPLAPGVDHYDEAHFLPEHGGTVGPLPDGTVIRVERVED